MKKYLLLRDNQQSGPYTAEGLQKMTLRKFDLIWIEGESIMWKYPSEIREFKHFAPQADITEGTKVNARKEKQIVYFQLHIKEMEFKTKNISFINQPDALLADVPAGYEYLVMAQDYKIADDSVKFQDKIEEIITEEALTEVKQLLNRSQPFEYTILGAAQLIDVPERIADASVFTSTMDMPVRVKRKKKGESSAPFARKKKNITPGIAGWITVMAAAFMHLKL
ncbi:MAG: hypothetical protein KF746_04085 [Chitinophagaceae bacterium]|nr:hypothetical protein [Chitinophagaceae bacterium]